MPLKKKAVITLAIVVGLLAPTVPNYYKNHKYTVREVHHRRSTGISNVSYSIDQVLYSFNPSDNEISSMTNLYDQSDPRSSGLANLKDGDTIHDHWVVFVSPTERLTQKIVGHQIPYEHPFWFKFDMSKIENKQKPNI